MSRRCGPRTERRARPAASLTCRVRGSAPPPSPPRPRASAAGRGAGFPLSTPRQRSPRPPAAAPSGRKRLRSNRFQLLQTKPPGHPAGRGLRVGWAGPDVTPGPPPGQSVAARGGGRALRSWKGPVSAAERGWASLGSPRSAFSADLEWQRAAAQRRPGN